MKIISFLGIGSYAQTLFVLGDQHYETRFFPAAVAKFIRPEKILVLVTPAVKKHQNLPDLCAELSMIGVECQIVEIPEGRTEAELWEIFNKITGSVDEGEAVIFDVTHSFRSLPILVFLAVAYLKAAKNVQVEQVLYGAYEARDEHNHSPVFDLTPFVGLLDWLTATNRFVETGDGQPLAGLLRQGMPSGAQMGKDELIRSLGRDLRISAEAIKKISLALDVTRPIEAMQSACQLENALRRAMPAIEQRSRPFSILVEKVIQEYSQFALEDPKNKGLLEGLFRQLDMINWYVQHQQVIQAATLAREWLVSALAFHLSAPVFDYENGRKLIEKALNNAVELTKAKRRRIEKGPYDEAYQALSIHSQLTSLWSKMSVLRNDIAHVGMRNDPKPAERLKKDVAELPTLLQEIADSLLIKPDHSSPITRR